VDALISQIHRLPEGLMASLTWDRGTELAHHARLTLATDVAVGHQGLPSPEPLRRPVEPTRLSVAPSHTTANQARRLQRRYPDRKVNSIGASPLYRQACNYRRCGHFQTSQHRQCILKDFKPS